MSDVTTDEDPQSAWVRVYPVLMRTVLKDNLYRYTDTLLYVASSEERAADWCKENTDIEKHDPENWWWFVITEEAIDGDFSGIKGVVQMLSWDGEDLQSQPLNGYNEVLQQKDEG